MTTYIAQALTLSSLRCDHLFRLLSTWISTLARPFLHTSQNFPDWVQQEATALQAAKCVILVYLIYWNKCKHTNRWVGYVPAQGSLLEPHDHRTPLPLHDSRRIVATLYDGSAAIQHMALRVVEKWRWKKGKGKQTEKNSSAGREHGMS